MDTSIFQTSVNDAIQKSLSQDKILLIYLTDNNPNSIQFGDTFIINNQYLNQLKSHLVFLKLVKDSEEYTFFNQVFSNLIIPSIYVIKSGNLIDIISNPENELTLSSFNEKIAKIIGIKKKHTTLKEESAEVSVQKYREQLLKQQKQAKEDKERILRLLKLDKEERHRQSRELNTSVKENIHNSYENDLNYSIQLKLFNGQSIKHSFNNETTLSQIREFINDKFPEYQSTPYYFFKPIDRITYNDLDELNKTLKDLKLNKSLLIIKPSDHYGSNEYKKNGFQNLTNQNSSFQWLSNGINNMINSVFARKPVTNPVIEEVTLQENDQSLYSTPIIRSTESTRPSTPKPALMLNDSMNNFSIILGTDELKKKDERVVYNGNQLDLQDENSIHSNNGNFNSIGEDDL